MYEFSLHVCYSRVVLSGTLVVGSWVLVFMFISIKCVLYAFVNAKVVGAVLPLLGGLAW